MMPSEETSPLIPHQSLQVFLDHDFDHQDQDNSRLAVINSCLTTIVFGHNFVFWKKLAKSKWISLKKIVKFIQTYQEEWYHNNPQFQPALEKQFAHLYQKVYQHNLDPLNTYIAYTNPFRWKISIAIDLRISIESDIIEIKPDKIQKNYIFNRLTTHQSLSQIYQEMSRTQVTATVICDNTRCKGYSHQVSLKLSQIFKNFLYQKDSFMIDDHKSYLLKPDEPGKNLIVKVKASEVDKVLVQSLLQTYHKDNK